MEPKHEQTIFLLISQAGNAKSLAFEALTAAEEGDFAEAKQRLEQAQQELTRAHHTQTELIQKELNGTEIEKSLLLIHAQDHLMTAISEHQLIKHLIRLLQKQQTGSDPS